MGPEYQGISKDTKKFLQDVLKLAEKANINNAHAALKSKALVFILIIPCAKSV
jgi:hypothetical protein